MKIEGVNLSIDFGTLARVLDRFRKKRNVEVEEQIQIHGISYRVYEVDDNGFKAVKAE